MAIKTTQESGESRLLHDLRNIHTSLKVAYDLLSRPDQDPTQALELFAMGLDRLKELGRTLELQNG